MSFLDNWRNRKNAKQKEGKLFVLNENKASEFDFVIVLDGSGSMGEPSSRYPGKTRWEEQKETAFGIATSVDKFDDNGIDLILMHGGQIHVWQNVKADKVLELLNTIIPRGGTPTAEALAERPKSSWEPEE